MLASQQIVQALATRLSGNTDAGTSVFTDRLFPLDEAELPAWRIFAAEESVEPLTMHVSPVQQHDLVLTLEPNAKAATGIDATIAALHLQALQALFDTLEHATLGLPGVQLQLRRIGPMDFSERTDLQLATRPMQINASYRTVANAPETFV